MVTFLGVAGVIAAGPAALRAETRGQQVATWLATARNPAAPLTARQDAIENLLNTEKFRNQTHAVIMQALQQGGSAEWLLFLLQSLGASVPDVDEYPVMAGLFSEGTQSEPVRVGAASRLLMLPHTFNRRQLPATNDLVRTSFRLANDKHISFWFRSTAANLFAAYSGLATTNPETVVALVGDPVIPSLRGAELRALIAHVDAGRTSDAQTQRIGEQLVAAIETPEVVKTLFSDFDDSQGDNLRQLEPFVPALIERIRDVQRPMEQRIAAVTILRHVPPESAAQVTLLTTIAEREGDEELQIGIVDSLVQTKTQQLVVTSRLRELLRHASGNRAAAAVLQGLAAKAMADPRQTAETALSYLKVNETKPQCAVPVATNLAEDDWALDEIPESSKVNPCIYALEALESATARPDEVLPKLQGIVNGPPTAALFAAAARALGAYGINALPARKELLRLLQIDETRQIAATALGELGRQGAIGLPHLVRAFDHDSTKESGFTRSSAYATYGVAIDKIRSDMISGADEIAGRSDTFKDAMRYLNESIKLTGDFAPHFKASEREPLERIRQNLIGARSALQNAERARLLSHIIRTIQDSKALQIALGITAWLAAWLLVCRLLLRYRPLALLSWHRRLKPYSAVKIAKIDIPIPLSELCLVSFFAFNDRVLDAWVAKYIEVAGKRFLARDTVKKRLAHIQLPAELDGKTVQSGLTAGLIREILQQRTCLLIHGEGGAGKTSLACQMAFWGMSDDVSQRLCSHRTLPILIDHSLTAASEGRDALRDAIAGQLATLIDESDPVPDELLDRLLRKGRLLVIVDHFSEMPEDTRAMIRPVVADFPVRLLVITSRLPETLDGAVTARIRPLRIRFADISRFMQLYLEECGALENLDPIAFHEYCGRLAQIAGGSDVTVLFAKLFADLMAGRNAATFDPNMPRNAPELVLSYLNNLNANRAAADPNNREVQKAARIAAFECVRRECSPQSAAVDLIVEKIGQNGRDHLEYLQQRLGVVQSAGPAEDSIRFVLDPLAEYLAAIERIETAAANEIEWRTFLRNLRALGTSIDRARGYIRALVDCIQHTATAIPDFVLPELKHELDETKEAA